MPKETVQYANKGDWSSTEMSVHWAKEGGYVQVALTRHAYIPQDPEAECSRIHSDHQNCQTCADAPKILAELRKEAEGKPVMMRGDSTPAPSTSELDDPVTVFTEIMSRDEINRMIRALRRARDQAYGADA